MKEEHSLGIDAHAPGAKLDSGKPDMGLLLTFGRALEAVAEVATFGADKYSRDGWVSVPDGIHRYTAAMLRHAVEEPREMCDKDSGLLHAAHTAWNAMARLELMLRRTQPINGFQIPAAGFSHGSS